MENTVKNTVVQQPAEVEQQDCSLEVKQARINNYEKKVKIVGVIIGGISLALCLFFLASYFIFGASQFYSLKFSFPALFVWLDELPKAVIKDPEAMLAKFIIGCIFFALYIFFAIPIVKNAVKVINRFSPLCDFDNSKVDHKVVALEVTDLTSNCFILMLNLMLMGRTTGVRLPVAATVCIILYALFFIAVSLAKIYYTCYDVENNEFFKKTFLINVAKTISTTFFAIGLIIFTLRTPLFDFTYSIAQNFNNPNDYEGALFIKHFLMPFVNLFLVIQCIKLLNQIIRLDKKSTTNTNVNFYNKTYQVNNYGTEMQKKANKRVKIIIFFAVLIILLDVFLTCFNSKGEFFIPYGIGTLLAKTIFNNLHTILIPIGISVIFKTNTKVPVVIQPKKIK